MPLLISYGCKNITSERGKLDCREDAVFSNVNRENGISYSVQEKSVGYLKLNNKEASVWKVILYIPEQPWLKTLSKAASSRMTPAQYTFR